ncbi:major histocompatibility complex class I-related gene protein isoform X2 [Amia ocellicauda]|uniref:major histocompatibility complex class I-related gene protein isoform X2 n=1 Tax=Amia ocellicauda TaxID=2972642 RepID=UPI0034642CF6
MIRAVVFCFLFCFQWACAAVHILEHHGMVITDGTKFSEYMQVSAVDGVPFIRFNSSLKEGVSLVDWINKSVVPEFIFTRDTGCVLYPDNSTYSFLTHGYDAKDFISFDVQNKSWIAVDSQAAFYKRKREESQADIEMLHKMYKNECKEQLKTILHYGQRALAKTVQPEVRLLQRKSALSVVSELTCHVTGFYPQAIMVQWFREDGVVLEEGVWSGEVLPNGDNTYQLRKSLTVRAEEQDMHRYSCQVEFSSLTGRVTVTWVPQKDASIGYWVQFLIAIILILIMAFGVIVYIKIKGLETVIYRAARTFDRVDPTRFLELPRLQLRQLLDPLCRIARLPHAVRRT